MDEADLAADPLAQLAAWLEEAKSTSAQGVGMTLATAAADGRPSARQVLLRGLDERGLVFFTNHGSRKARELQANPRAAVVFHWYELGRQVRVEGAVTRIDPAESEAYWRTRPRGSQIAAWASPQSDALSGRAELDGLYAGVDAQFVDDDIPLPGFWGGYRVVPESIEFWQHDDDRLHDRVRYVRERDVWRRERLAP
jgi:pyridoxamine 5'-phosphate oxidase